MTKTVDEIMTPNPACATVDMTVEGAAIAMAAKEVGSLPVVDGNRLVGMITDRDIVTRVVAQGEAAGQATVGEVASTDPVAVDPRQDVDEAARLMATHQVRRLPVLDDGMLVGIVSQADVALEAKERKTGEMVEEISRPSESGRS